MADDVVEVYREPVTVADGKAGYRAVQVFSLGETAQPLHFPDCALAAGDILPAGEAET